MARHREEYFKLYDYRGGRSVVQRCRGEGGWSGNDGSGPGEVRGISGCIPEALLSDSSAADGKPVPLDFISFHPKGNPETVDGHVRMGLANELRAAKRVSSIVAKYPQLKRLPIMLSEADPEGCAACSMKTNPANAYRNGPLYAPIQRPR